jgi:hypothetical protein
MTREIRDARDIRDIREVPWLVVVFWREECVLRNEGVSLGEGH